MKKVLSFVGKVWNLPNTLLGLLIGGVGKLLLGRKCRVFAGYNAIIFTGIPLGGAGIGGMTLGNVIICCQSNPPDFILRHEAAHTRQGEILGIFYIPLHLLCLIFYLSPRFRDIHPLEKGPYRKEKPF